MLLSEKASKAGRPGIGMAILTIVAVLIWFLVGMYIGYHTGRNSTLNTKEASQCIEV